jgi:uncharacterized repeat protein (TIGR01451 family)
MIRLIVIEIGIVAVEAVVSTDALPTATDTVSSGATADGR